MIQSRLAAALAIGLLLPAIWWSAGRAAPAPTISPSQLPANVEFSGAELLTGSAQAPSVAPVASPGAGDTGSQMFTWTEGGHLTIAEYWNTPSRAGCDYAANPWPQAQLAAERAYVLGARLVLRNEWNIINWIGQNRAALGEARIHGTETNCHNGHTDYPAHFHVFYLAPMAGAYAQVNSHMYPDALGKIRSSFVLPNLCGQNRGSQPLAGSWIDILDETCTPAWQQRFTTAGDVELRRDATSATYTLRLRSTNGDLSALDVLTGGSVIYGVDIIQYDAVAKKMVARLTDYRQRQVTTETWAGNPATGDNLTSHTTQVAGLPTTPPGPAPATPWPRGPHRTYLPLLRHGW